MILPDGRCFLCALGQCRRCVGPPCNHDHLRRRRYENDDPLADQPPGRKP